MNLGGTDFKRAWSNPNVLVGLLEQQTQTYYIKGSEKCSPLTLSAAHEHLNQLESLLILNLYSMGKTLGLGQNPHIHRTFRGTVVAWPLGR